MCSSGKPVEADPALYVVNHTGYLDIEILGAALEASFIAKADVADWPWFGWLAKLQRTVFIERTRAAAGGHRNAIVERFDQGDRLILFPEGTSSDGNHVLPFKIEPVQRRRISPQRRADPGAAGRGRLHPPRRHSARPRAAARFSPGMATWIWRRICGPRWAWAY